MGYGGGGFLSEAGLRKRAQAQGRVFGAGGEGVRIWAFWLWDFGITRKKTGSALLLPLFSLDLFFYFP